MIVHVSLLAVTLLEFGLVRGEDANKECITVDGPGSGKACIFPFTFLRTMKTYNECTPEFGREYWCSTKVNETGFHASGSWGACQKGCPGVPDDYNGTLEISCKSVKGNDCVFTYSIDGFSYPGCVELEGKSVCAVKGESGKYKKEECSDECPKSSLITMEDVPVDAIINKLLKEPIVYTSIERGEGESAVEPKCEDMLEEKFKALDASKLPEQVKDAKTWDEAYDKVCKAAEYCKDVTEGFACGSTKMTKRFNVLKADDGAKFTPQADCEIQCGAPD